MESALIVSSTEESIAFFTELLNVASISYISGLQSCAEARRSLLERDFDLVIINMPLRDETGENFARSIAVNGTAQVILVVRNEFFDAISAVCEECGVLTVAKPMNKSIFWSALTLAKSAQSFKKRMQSENAWLKKQIEDIRIVDRAKWILVSCMNMTEQDAHRYLEKQAMDKRTTKRAISEEILKTYES